MHTSSEWLNYTSVTMSKPSQKRMLPIAKTGTIWARKQRSTGL